MDYSEIVLQGFLDENTRNFLEDFFFREFRKAEKEQFFEPDEFFRGCLRVIEKWKKDFEHEAFKYLRELIFTVDGIKSGTIPVSALEGKTIKESKQWLIEYYERELKNVQENGIKGVSNEQITITLYSENRLISYNLNYSELLRIERSILIAFQKTKTNIEPLQPVPIVQPQKESSKPETIELQTLIDSQNLLIPKLPIKEVYEYFKILTEQTNKFNEFYLTKEQLFTFIKSTFIDKKPVKQKFKSFRKKDIRKIFYQFYFDNIKNEGNHTEIKRKYFNILNDAFDGFNKNDYTDFHKI